MENRDNYTRYRVGHNGEMAHARAAPGRTSPRVRISKYDVVCTENPMVDGWITIEEVKTQKGWDGWYKGLFIEAKFLQLSQKPTKVFGSVSNQRPL